MASFHFLGCSLPTTSSFLSPDYQVYRAEASNTTGPPPRSVTEQQRNTRIQATQARKAWPPSCSCPTPLPLAALLLPPFLLYSLSLLPSNLSFLLFWFPCPFTPANPSPVSSALRNGHPRSLIEVFKIPHIWKLKMRERLLRTCFVSLCYLRK